MEANHSVTLKPSILLDDVACSWDCGGRHPIAECASLDTPPTSMATTLTQARRLLRPPRPVIPMEAQWRCLTRRQDETEAMRVAASRWQGFEGGTRKVEAGTAGESHLVKIVLRATNLSLQIDGKSVHDGVATPGMVHVTEPGASARSVFRGPYDTLHLHVSNALIAECLLDMPPRAGPLMTVGRGLTPDPTMERLGRALLAVGQDGDTLGPLYTESIGVAIVARLLSGGRGDCGTTRSGMVMWRLKRTIDYIEAGIGDPIRLADMASASGLSRMHFAAQFKASTGLRPHEYLLRRRIERAQELLLVDGLSIIDIALSVGFQTHSHFTTTFVRFVGQAPHAWRLAHGAQRGGR